MGRNFFFLRGAFLLLFTQGCFCNNHKAKWTFTFPKSKTAVRGSDVEIPCTFTSPADYGEVRIVWYKYSFTQYPIVYSDDPSEIIPEYRGRTSLIHNGANSCSLRITDVTETERYYPGISEEINSYIVNKKEDKKAVWVNVQGCSDDFSCKGWRFTYPRSIQALKGSCVEIPCKFNYPGGIQFTLFWYKKDPEGFPKIFSNRTSSNMEENYKGRTFLVGNSMDSCSLRINDVQEPVEIYPGVSEEINGYNLNEGRICKVSVKDAPPPPWMTGSDHMIENEPVQITCSVDHTCPSSPPSITWNKPELPVTMSHKDLDKGIQRINSTITYNPSYKDDKSQLECTVTFPNNINSSRSVTLNITYAAKNEKHKKSVIIGGTVGFTALVLIVLVTIFCIIKRRKRTSVHREEKRETPTQGNVKITEKITMENTLYGNFGGAAEQNSPGTQNSHLSHNNDGEETKSGQCKEEKMKKSIVYTSVALSPANPILKTTRTSEESEYSQLNI